MLAPLSTFTFWPITHPSPMHAPFIIWAKCQTFVFAPTSAPASTHAEASLLETLRVMTATIITDACIRVPLMGRRLDAAGIVADPQLSQLLTQNLSVFAKGIETTRIENENRYKEFM